MLDGTRLSPRLLLCVVLCWFAVGGSAVASDWQPITPEELKMTSVPQAPRASAIYLYRQIDRDDAGPSELIYERIKILTDEGKSYGNVEIPYYQNNERISGIDARTIRPDGSVIKFDGEVFDKTLAKSRKLKYFAKTFTMPEVQVGSIIEYRYRRVMDAGYVYNSHWILSSDLFTKLARFSLTPAEGFALQWSWPMGLPPDSKAPAKDHGKIRMEAHDVPAFFAEDFALPDDILKYRVDFTYYDDGEFEKDPDVFWRRQGKKLFREVDNFIDEPAAMREAVAQIVAPDDSPDIKLRKIYDRVQRVRNLSFERDKTEQEEKREKLKSIHDVEEVWNRGYADGSQITWLFLALARAAGIQADPVQISTRDSFAFQRELMNRWQLNTNVVRVTVGGVEQYVDPGVQFAPYGVLPWNETYVMGLLLDKNGGSWVATPIPFATQSRTERKAVMVLSDDGSLDGKLTITYTGLQALTRRLAERHADAVDRKRYLEADAKDSIPVGVDIELVNQPDWSSSSPMLIAEFKLRVPGWASQAGSRLLLPASLFTGHESEAFGHAARTYALYFEYPYQQNDYVSIRIPKEMQIGSLPKAQSKEQGTLSYGFGAELSGNTLTLHRQLSVNAVLLPVEQFVEVRTFFQTVKAADEEQIVIATAGSAGKH